MKRTGMLLAVFALTLPVAAPSEAATIYACRNKLSGALRVVMAPTDCLGTEARMSWNTVGPRGPQGIQGTQGEKGDKGEQGIQGIQGVQGPKGDTGTQGPPGAAGTPQPVYHFAGLTTAVFDRLQWLPAQQACEAEFAGGRLATTLEVKFAAPSPILPDRMWVSPALPLSRVLRGTDIYTYDAAGFLIASTAGGYDYPKPMALWRDSGVSEYPMVAVPVACSVPE